MRVVNDHDRLHQAGRVALGLAPVPDEADALLGIKPYNLDADRIAAGDGPDQDVVPLQGEPD